MNEYCKKGVNRFVNIGIIIYNKLKIKFVFEAEILS